MFSSAILACRRRIASLVVCIVIGAWPAKEAMRRLQVKIADENIDDLIRHTYASADFREGMTAFLEKRPPKWTNK